MKIAVVALTKNGTDTALRLGNAIESDIYVKIPPKEEEKCTVFSEKLKELIEKIYHQYDAFVLIMATGIAFRTFAPYIEKKDIDPALVVMDEKASFVISLLSGHLGGANELTSTIAKKMKAIPVITTATDINNKIAFDMIAKKNNLTIENIEKLPSISSTLVNGDSVGFICDFPIEGEVPNDVILHKNIFAKNTVVISNKTYPSTGENILFLRPKNLILGVGCRKNTPFEQIEKAFLTFMEQKRFSLYSIKAMASIDLKKEEQGLLAFSEKYKIPFFTYSAEELEPFTKEEHGSAFVKEITGTASVSESAALAKANQGKTIVEKTIIDSITFSLAEEHTIIGF